MDFIITRLGGGPGFTWSDADLWGLECALHHALQDGYFDENKEWAQQKLEQLATLRVANAIGKQGEPAP